VEQANPGAVDRKPHSWKRVACWLILFKSAYLAVVLAAVVYWPDFDQDRAYAVSAQWFDASGAALTEEGAGLGRHFATWDAQHYLWLSAVGYGRDVKSCAFYPLWPLTLRGLSVFTGGNRLIAGMVLANVLSLAAWVLFYQVTARRFGESVALWALVFLVIFPGSLFYQFIYSEPLFFLLTMLLWFGLERRRYGLAWIAAFFLPLSRAVGVFSVLPIAWRWLLDRPWPARWRWAEAERKRLRGDAAVDSDGADWRGTALLAAAPLGLAAYFGLMWVWTGNPFEGMEAQKYWGVHSIANLWDVPIFVIGFFEPSTWHGFRGSLLDRGLFLLLFCTLPTIWRLGKDMVAWTYVLGILPSMSGTFTSFTRFACCVFPMFIALAVVSDGPKCRWLRLGLLAAFGTLHLVLLWRFVNFRWAG
jgi:hypothetical protein